MRYNLRMRTYVIGLLALVLVLGMGCAKEDEGGGGAATPDVKTPSKPDMKTPDKPDTKKEVSFKCAQPNCKVTKTAAAGDPPS